MAIKEHSGSNDGFLFQRNIYYTIFYGTVSFVLVLVALLLLYVSCSKKYRLNWFEKNLLERATKIDSSCSQDEYVSIATESEIGSTRSIANLVAEDKFWVPLNHCKNHGNLNEIAEFSGDECPKGLQDSKSSLVSFSEEADREPQPIARSDKQVILSTTKPARPRVCSMNTKLDHTKIDSSFYQEASRSPSTEEIRGTINVSITYDHAAGILSVRLIQAKDLLPRDFSGTSDPYAKIRLLPDCKNVWQTRIHKKTVNPVFDEDFVFEVPSSSLNRRTLEIILYDFDAYSRHLSLGEVRIPLVDLDLSEKMTLWKGLGPCSEPHEKAELGDVMVTLSFLQSAERLTVVVNKARNLRVVDDIRMASEYIFQSTQTAKNLFSKNASCQSSIFGSFKKKPLFIVSALCGLISKDEKKTKLDTTEEVVHNVALATIALKDGNLEKSEKMLTKSLDLAETHKLSLGIISTCDMLSSLAIKIGDYEKAEDLLIKALDNLHSQGVPEDDSFVVSFNLKLSRIYSNNGHDDLAELGFRNCLNLQKNKLQNNIDEEAFLLWTTIQYWYGKFLLNKNRYEEAKECFKESYQTSLKVKFLTSSQIMVILYNLGEVCQILGEHDEAMNHFLKGVSLDKRRRNPDLAYFYNKLGAVCMTKGMYQEAEFWCVQGQNFAIRVQNPDAERESKESLQKLSNLIAVRSF